ncbi:MAG: hypothetical protein R3343_10905 [Nitriliruptorales bacterium]|nr:hypothetical protein [Nitriliruptorales bacterium]
MIKRIFSLFFGIGLGLLVGAFIVRRLDQATRAVAPANIATQAGRFVGELGANLRAAAEAGRQAADAKEAELRSQYNVPRVRDTLGG